MGTRTKKSGRSSIIHSFIHPYLHYKPNVHTLVTYHTYQTIFKSPYSFVSLRRIWRRSKWDLLRICRSLSSLHTATWKNRMDNLTWQSFLDEYLRILWTVFFKYLSDHHHYCLIYIIVKYINNEFPYYSPWRTLPTKSECTNSYRIGRSCRWRSEINGVSDEVSMNTYLQSLFIGASSILELVLITLLSTAVRDQVAYQLVLY